MCTSIGDIFNSVNKCENGAPYISLYYCLLSSSVCISHQFFANLFFRMLSCTSSSHHQVSLSYFLCFDDTSSTFLTVPSLLWPWLSSHPLTIPYHPKPSYLLPEPLTTVIFLQFPPFDPSLYLRSVPLLGL